jgi:hypothetical protein
MGLALMLLLIVFYIDLETPRRRKKDKPEEYETRYLSVWKSIPWSVKITATAIMIFMLIFLVEHLMHPNSW